MIRNNNFTKNTLLIAFTLFAFNSWAQNDMDVTIEGELRLEIKDANKFQAWPEYKENVVEIPTIKYALIPNKITVAIEPSTIRPAKINVDEKIKKLYKGYVKGGFGLYANSLAELYYMDGRSRKGSYSISAKHEGSAGAAAIDKNISDSYSVNQLDLWGKKFVKRHAIQGDFNWKREKRNFYGFDPILFDDVNVNIDDIDRITNGLGADISLKSYHRDTTMINYIVDLGFNNFRDNFNGQMNEVELNATANKHITDNLFIVDLKLNYNNFSYTNRISDNKDTQERVLFVLKPQASTTKGDLNVKVGMNITVDGNSTAPFHFYPLAEVNYNLFDNLFVPYAGLTGYVTQNTYQTMVQTNPWVATDVDVRNENTKLQLYGGVRGTLSANTSFNAKVSQTTYEDFAFFVNDSIGGVSHRSSEFVVEYDRLSVTDLMAEVTINESKKLDIFLQGHYFIYGLDKSQQTEPWYQPTTKFTAIGRYNIDNTIIAQIEVYTVGKTKAKSLAPVSDTAIEDDGYYIVNQKGYADINLLVEYRYTKRLSAFVKVNNLFSSKYMRYNNYSTQRLGAMLGLSYSF